MHSNMFTGVGKLSHIDIDEGKAWLETGWGSVHMTWQSDNANFKTGFEQLQDGDTVHIAGRVWMYERHGELNDATVLVATVEAVKPATRARRANKHFTAHTKEIDDAVRFGTTYKQYWMEEREKRNREYEMRREAEQAKTHAEQQLEDSRSAFREALMTEMVGGDNTDERP